MASLSLIFSHNSLAWAERLCTAAGFTRLQSQMRSQDHVRPHLSRLEVMCFRLEQSESIRRGLGMKMRENQEVNTDEPVRDLLIHRKKSNKRKCALG